MYDPLNRLVLTILPEGNTVETKYDQNGNKVRERDGRHNGNDYMYDALNRVSKVTNADGKDTSFWYNEEGKLTKQVSATGLETKFYLLREQMNTEKRLRKLQKKRAFLQKNL